jgi:hypothetical protein
LTTPVFTDGPPTFADEEYDVYAVMDAVPMVVRELDTKGSRIMSLFSAFLGPLESRA